MSRYKQDLIDYENVDALSEEELATLEEAINWRLGDFDLLDLPEPKRTWRDSYLDKLNSGDREPIDYQGME